jgi:hypothetical protein
VSYPLKIEPSTRSHFDGKNSKQPWKLIHSKRKRNSEENRFQKHSKLIGNESQKVTYPLKISNLVEE